MQSIPSIPRISGAAAAFLALIVVMTADRPGPGSLGIGVLGIVAFAISRLFKAAGSVPSPATPSRTEPVRPEPVGFAGYGLSASDDATSLHPALTAGIALPRR
jgi:hypothetical protein